MFYFFFFTEYKNEWKQYKFRRQKKKKKEKKSDFYKKIEPFHIDDIDVNKILVSKKEQYDKYNSFKYFVGYNDNEVIRPLCLKVSQMTG